MNTALDACFAFSRSYTQILVILVVNREKCQEARCIFILLPCQHLLRYYTILLHSQVFDNLVQAVSLGLMHGFGYSCWAVSSCLSLRLSIPFQHLNSIHVESLPRWFSGKESTCPHRGHGFDPWPVKILRAHASSNESHAPQPRSQRSRTRVPEQEKPRQASQLERSPASHN